jgi:hypothetical protein
VLLEIRQYGALTAQAIPLRAYAAAGRLQSFTLHAGDPQGILHGSDLAEVSSLSLKGLTFTPEKTASSPGSGLAMLTKDAKGAAKLTQGETAKAKVTLTDGRVLTVQATVDAPRPQVQLIGKSVQPSASSTGSNIELANPDELPQDAKLRFSIRAQSPKAFTRGEQIEVATSDDVFSSKLSLDNGGLTLENSTVALATLDPAKAFGPSAFGPLKFRVIVDGTAGDWQPLATLVRLPELQALKCPAITTQQCRLSGANLFLVDSISSDPAFANPVQVPDGFPGFVLPVPQPRNGALYVRLRDDPNVVNRITLTAENLAPPGSQQARPAYQPNAPAPPPAPLATPSASAVPASQKPQALGNSASPAPSSTAAEPSASAATPPSGAAATAPAQSGQSTAKNPRQSSSPAQAATKPAASSQSTPPPPADATGVQPQ